MTEQNNTNEQAKAQSLDAERENSREQYLTTNQGLRINHTDDSLIHVVA